MADVNEFAGVVALAIKAAMAPVLERVALMEAQVTSLAAFDQSVTALRERVVVVETKAALPVPVLEAKSLELPPEILRRVEMLEQRPLPSEMLPPVDLTPLQDRLGKLETKAAERPEFVITPSQFAAAMDKTERITSELTKDLGALRERVAVVEVRQPVAGPAGPPGTNGRDGVDGLGFDDITAVQDADRHLTIKAVRGDRVKSLGTMNIPAAIYRDVWMDGVSYDHGDMVTWAGSTWHCNESTTSKPGESKAWTLMVKRGRDGKDGKDAVTLPVVTVK